MKPASRLLLGTLTALALAGCASQEALTAKATDCSRWDLSILPSRYSEQGSTTTWCAACNKQRYRCVGNADRTRAECRRIQQDETC
jgi:hypothetical protein